MILLVKRLYEDLTVLHENTLPDHGYFIPTSEKAGRIGAPLRESSDRIQFLSGRDWDFRYFGSIHALTDEFFRPDYRPGEDWKPEPVPFAWQMRGYDAHQYTNIRYPFPFDPPYVPQDNPCGAYRHTFTWHPDPDAPRTHLHFEGVDSCFYVWLNGTYVGYSQVTHRTSEFDVTDLLRDGENLLAVLVLKWCDGSYLEDQDKFRMSGIIRDVYLMSRPERHIRDYVITTELSPDLGTAGLRIRFFYNNGPIPVTVRLFDAASSENENPPLLNVPLYGGDEIHLTVKNPLLWIAETPHLYPLLIETEHETISERVGFRKIEVRDGVVLLNGSPIKFRGVNRHESDPVTGPVVTRAQMEKDLLMIKEHNFNAVRASHYPNVPYFYQLCDELGFYVIDEADNESHGTGPLAVTEDDYVERMKKAHVRIADNPAFIEPTLDRVRSMIVMNRNRPSILVWSMGNECGYGCTFEEALKWTKETDPGRLTHYESAFYLPTDRTYDLSDIDLFGRMYPAFSEITDYLADDPEMPLLLVEYCHSMGNGPGDFREYRDLTEKYPRLCGGFVWEWCDHAVYKGTAPNGKAMYAYGGDHGELQHDGNFCLDGLVYPDRTPHTGLLEYKNVHRPLRASYDPENETLTVRNFLDFLDPEGLIEARWALTLDGETLKTGDLALPHIAPHGSSPLPLPLAVPEKGRAFLTVTYVLKKALGILPAGHELGFDELRLPNQDERNQKVLRMASFSENEAPRVAEAGTDLVIKGSDFTYRFDTLSGRFTSLSVKDREFLQKPVDFNLYRAPTDNDRPIADLWKWLRLDHTLSRAYEVTHKTRDGALIIRLTQSAGSMSVQPVIRTASEYRIFADGTILMEISARKDPEIVSLPRLGLRLFLDPALTEAEYYGIGPHESYIDKCRSGKHGIYKSAITDLHEDYIRPQENGSRFDTDYVILSGGGLAFTAATADAQTFSFNASVYTEEELEAKAHNYELEPCGSTVLCLDHKMAGIGSKSCGPDLSKEYRVDTDTYHFAFRMKPKVL